MKRAHRRPIPVIDLFAGPGGLGEGFSALRDRRGHPVFRIALSIEKEQSAFETLRLRSFLRQFPKSFPKEYYAFINEDRAEPDWAMLYPEQWEAACQEVLRLELGSRDEKKRLDARLHRLRSSLRDAIVIGGPPCQAYSLVGRARNRGIEGYDPKDDHRHFLYREYIDVLRTVRPAAFVMENVKGLLSSNVAGMAIFARVMSDLRAAGGAKDSYRLLAIAQDQSGRMRLTEPHDPRSFVVRSEDYGIPQARHRVIVIGLRNDVAPEAVLAGPEAVLAGGAAQDGEADATVADVLRGLPRQRSRLSSADSDGAWLDLLSDNLRRVASLKSAKLSKVRAVARRLLPSLQNSTRLRGIADSGRPYVGPSAAPALKRWILDRKLKKAPNNSARSHMDSDLGRYLFAALFGQVHQRSPKAGEFPRWLAPKHANWTTGKFADRFRVQVFGRPSTTITSHIAKDGHYFIHPDPLQCRSLTVREAARLQTFPDNYLFKGNRTQQYTQVGNAVPPYLALQIAQLFERSLPSINSE